MGIGDLSKAATAAENLADAVPVVRRVVDAVAETFQSRAVAEVFGHPASALADAAHTTAEVPFHSLATNDQMLAALANSSRIQGKQSISRLDAVVGERAATFNLQPDQLRHSLFSARWTAETVQVPRGRVKESVFTFNATIPGAKAPLYVAPLDGITPDTKLFLTAGPEKYVVSAELPPAETDQIRAIVTKVPEHETPTLVDVRPGKPIEPTQVETNVLMKAIDHAGLAVPFGQVGSLPGRIEITAEQLQIINRQLPADARFSIAKTSRPEDSSFATIMVPREEMSQYLKPTPGAEGISVGELRLLRRFLNRVPNLAEREEFERQFSELPSQYRPRFVSKINSNTRHEDLVERIGGTHGVLFEMSRFNRTLQQGLEEVSAQPAHTGKISYNGYPKDSNLTKPPADPRKSGIDNDIPIVRDGKPYILEVKTYNRKAYGGLFDDRNQLLKYQAAIDQNKVSGATLEARGILDPGFLSWVRAEQVGTSNLIPNIEVLHTVPLPSGAEFTFPIRQTSSQLRFANNEHLYTEADRKIVAGVQNAVQDGSIDKIITSHNITNAPPDVQSFLAKPENISDVDIYNKYEALRLQALWDNFAAKAKEPA